MPRADRTARFNSHHDPRGQYKQGVTPPVPDPRLERLRAKIAGFPRTPGVYLMKDCDGVVLYIGKARDLRSRVASYFQDGGDLFSSRGLRIVHMTALVEDIDILECETEVDALLKESRLIKDIQPHYNERLKDDKSFPYLEIRTGDDFPGAYLTRAPRPRGPQRKNNETARNRRPRRFQRTECVRA